MGEAKRRKAFDPNYGKVSKNYHSYQRANKMYDLVFACHMPEPYDKDDKELECEMAVIQWANMLFNTPNINPLKRKYKNFDLFMEWFDKEYHLHQC